MTHVIKLHAKRKKAAPSVGRYINNVYLCSEFPYNIMSNSNQSHN